MEFIDKRLRGVRIILAALLLGYSVGSLLLRDEKLVEAGKREALEAGEDAAEEVEKAAKSAKRAARKASNSAS
jgi:hypothetical protein